MAAAIEVISRLADRGVTFQIEDSGGLRVNGVSRLTEREKVALRAHKGARLRDVDGVLFAAGNCGGGRVLTGGYS